VPIVALYLLRFGRRRRAVSSLGLWRDTLAQRNRWRTPVSLAAQLALLALLVLALAEPYRPATRSQARNVVLIVDTSASMNATDAAPTRLVQAVTEAQRLVDKIGQHEQMAVVASDAAPRILCRSTGDRRLLRAALARIRPTNAPGRLADAVRLAHRMVAGYNNPTILVLSDGCDDGVTESLDDDRVRLIKIGGEAANVGVTHLAVRPDPLLPSQAMALVRVENFGQQAATGSLEFGLSGGETRREQLSVPAGEAVAHSWSLDASDGGLLQVVWTVDDALAADNRAWVSIGAQRPVGVLLVSPGNPSLESALASNPLVELTVEQEVPAELTSVDVLVLDGLTPPQLPACPILAVAPTGSCGLWQRSGTVSVIARHGWDGLLPELDIDLSGVVFEEFADLNFASPATTLAATVGGRPILSELTRPDGNVLVLHPTLDKSDLAQRDQFPLLLAAAIKRLTPSPRRDSDVQAAANLCNRRESNLLSIGTGRANTFRSGGSTPIWWWVVAAAVLLFVGEWWLYQRRFIV